MITDLERRPLLRAVTTSAKVIRVEGLISGMGWFRVGAFVMKVDVVEIAKR